MSTIRTCSTCRNVPTLTYTPTTMSPAQLTRKVTKLLEDLSIKWLKQRQAAELQERVNKKKQEQEAEEKQLA